MTQYNEPWTITQHEPDDCKSVRTVRDATGKAVLQFSTLDCCAPGSIPCSQCFYLGTFEPALIERIVACVNACAGLTNEQLADGIEPTTIYEEACEHEWESQSVIDTDPKQYIDRCSSCGAMRVQTGGM